LALPAQVAAEDSVYSFNIWGGLGGPIDQENAGLSNSSYQLGFSVQPEDQLLVGLRVGQIDMSGESIGDLFDPTIDYATVVGEYRFTESFYESGLFIGLGLYRLDGVQLVGGSVTDESVGLVLGISGEFVLTDRVGFLLEASGHFVRFDSVDTLVMGHAGFAIHF
jgi:hypothetical protein